MLSPRIGSPRSAGATSARGEHEVTPRAEDQGRCQALPGGRRGDPLRLRRPPARLTQSSGGAAGPGHVAANIGRAKQAEAYGAGERAELRLASPMALAITPRRLLVLSIGSPIGLGLGGAVKELVSAVPLSEVDSIEIKRLAIGKVVTVTVHGEPIELEANATADARGLAEAFERSKAAA